MWYPDSPKCALKHVEVLDALGDRFQFRMMADVM